MINGAPAISIYIIALHNASSLFFWLKKCLYSDQSAYNPWYFGNSGFETTHRYDLLELARNLMQLLQSSKNSV